MRRRLYDGRGSVVARWLDRGLDGWRIDVANMTGRQAEVDVALLFTTDPIIDEKGFVLLEGLAVALSNVDVVIARVMLDDHQGGLYAGGLILAKAVLFLPQFVVVVAFPSMSVADARRSMTLKALAMVLVMGVGGIDYLAATFAVDVIA